MPAFFGLFIWFYALSVSPTLPTYCHYTGTVDEVRQYEQQQTQDIVTFLNHREHGYDIVPRVGIVGAKNWTTANQATYNNGCVVPD